MSNWTKDQQSAIEDRGSNLLIAAAAGSGKTAVLVERIIRLITEDKIDIDSLLIVTFTNAAAGEMRERIANAIIKELDKKNENEDHLRKQITLLNRASITTIHSFCIEVVKKHFHLIDIDPSFRIGDVTETNILKQESMEEIFEEEYKEGNQAFFDLVESYGSNRDDIQLQELIEKIYTFIQSQPKPMQWLIEKMEVFNVDNNSFGNGAWIDALKSSLEIQFFGAKDLLMEAKRICLKPNGPEGYLNAINSDIEIIHSLLSSLSKDLSHIYSELNNIEFTRLGRLAKDVDSNLKDQAKDLRDKSKDIIKSITESIFARSPEEHLEDLKNSYPLMNYLCSLINNFINLYSEKKLEKGIVDFNDLEHYALRILENENVAQNYRDKFTHIFIDEYQDSNIVQETLINYIRRENNLFMVGDVKQSIYRFRLADPSLFIQKYESFSSLKGEINRRIDLSKNFRSREEIINGANYIFKNIMSKQLGEIDYNEDAYLYVGGQFEPSTDTAIELNIVEKNSNNTNDEIGEELEELNDIEVEAALVAKRIKNILSSEIYDHKQQKHRNIEFRDIVILMRTTQNWAHIFLETLLKENIPTYADIGTGYFESVEISIFINLLKIIDNRRQDIPLLSVMRSPIGGFTVEELVEIRLIDKRLSYIDGIYKYIEYNQENRNLKEKLLSFIEKLNSWAEMARYMKISELIWVLFSETNYYNYVAAMPGGFQRQANLRVLLDRATQFEQTSIRGLFNFIKFIEKLKMSKGDMGDAKILGENDNVVRIMSIHKSKGLEFPVVILAGTGKNFNLRDTNANVLLHKDLGIGPKYVDLNLRVYRDTIIKLSMKDKLKIESLSEEMRILYVALTRPVDKLIIFGSVKNLGKQVDKWCKPINNYLITSAKSYIDWFGMVLTKHPKLDNLRSIAESHFDSYEIIDDASEWVCNVFKRSDIALNRLEERIKEQKLKEQLYNSINSEDTVHKQIVEDRLNWNYLYNESTKIPSKLSVSEIKNSSIKDVDSMGYSIPPLIIKPKFLLGKKEYTKAEKGTILHFVMQHINMEEIRNGQTIEHQIQLMINKEIITEEEIMEIDINKITLFFNSYLGKRMLNSNKIYREVSFNMKRSAQEVIEGLKNCNENLLIQGTIDCYFEENNDLILVDYKSDEITEVNNVDAVIKRYEIQLQLYKEALERIINRKVKESYIYLFDINKEVLIKNS
ncbi:helicase-exonuclease AddAB subunit AddA [Serpentinicella alkaliphila]|uniref:ATP-dependent helicase/nuclease subunit A n=1 Tax=Serpentinicella alkaliphila TaxID=1734049 RepID=A0A4V2T4V2_9FIRM|nr:helicase-exonuclease AddAB subunit AddA [Serpentinicella alkaliphila]QUH25645.1 helicase-exonuclease AddAB subunit AddA [Serpentinicella alkaliphila]TCQ06644.1 DNA helicase/exodeoxyribonuclease V subunit A [Serpentinicella alkaliphila]